jgi:DNA-nicking Smr family endonuclease
LSKSRRDLTGEERRLWREVAKGVKSRRAPPDAGAPAPPRAAAMPVPISQAASQAARKPAPGAEAAPANRGAEKRVRRGQLEIAAALDLHGCTYDAAQSALGRFLRAAQARGDRAVIVITGVGRGGEGVLKKSFPGWLGARDLRAVVAAYAPAHRSHGGAGAFYVFLRRLG